MSPLPAVPAETFLEDRAPRFDATLPRQYMHKRAIEETFLTDVIVRESRAQLFACAQLPRSHALHNEVESGFHDLLLILEIARQGTTAYGHGILGVPEGTAFVMSGLRADVVELEALRQGEAPAELAIEVPLGGERRDKRGRLRGYSLGGTAAIDGRAAIAFGGEALLIPEALYGRVRRVSIDGPPAPCSAPVAVAPARVGRRAPRNVVVGDAVCAGAELRCTLIADTAHPSFFDHPLDHVPGMLMLEAARQTALLYVGERGWSPEATVLDACTADFTQYAALWPPACCTASARESTSAEAPAGSRVAKSAAPVERLRVGFSQAGQTIGHADVRLRLVGA